MAEAGGHGTGDGADRDRPDGQGPTPDAADRGDELFRLLIERVQDYAIFVMDPEGRVATWNAGAERIKGYTAADIVGRPYATFFTAEDRAAGRPARLLEQARRDGRVEDEGWRVRRDGSRFWADAVLTALTDARGRLRGYAKITRDMTARREAEEQARHNAALEEASLARDRALAEAERQRDAAERAYSSLQTFLGVVAHDLRSPLTGILGNAQLLRRPGIAASPEGRERALAAIADEGRRMQNMIAALADAARIGAGQLELRPEPMDLAALARRAVAAQATEQHRIVLEAPERLEGEWDPGLLARVLDNLLGNAVKYSPEGGEVRVRVGRQGGRAVVSVADRGLGIRREDLGGLFRPFARLETGREIAGSGLGLYIVHGIVAAHGGEVRAESAGPGQGSAFTVALPLSRESG